MISLSYKTELLSEMSYAVRNHEFDFVSNLDDFDTDNLCFATTGGKLVGYAQVLSGVLVPEYFGTFSQSDGSVLQQSELQTPFEGNSGYLAFVEICRSRRNEGLGVTFLEELVHEHGSLSALVLEKSKNAFLRANFKDSGLQFKSRLSFWYAHSRE